MGFVKHERRGITLMEVLIAIGILAIGLSSVVALVPAGQAQASRAVLLDRASNLAANALADAATFGLLRPDCVTVIATSTTPIVIDPVEPPLSALQLPMESGSMIAVASLRDQGVFATSGSAAPPAVHQLFTQSRDDIVVSATASSDDPAANVFVAGARAFNGRMSCLLCISGTSQQSRMGRLSAVVFHGRDPSAIAVSGTIRNLQVTIPPAALGELSFRDVVKSGVVLWEPSGQRFHQVASAAIDPSGTSAFVTLSPGGLLFSGTVAVSFLPGSIGVAERPFVPETVGNFAQ